MASTITIQNVVDWARTFTRLVPIVGVGGFSNEPALSIANQVIQEILAPPFNWKWNRVEAAAFDTVDKTQDYTRTITDFGWLESCVLEDKDSTQTPKPTREIEVVQMLPKESVVENPVKVAVVSETASNINVRFWPVPGTYLWTAYLIYQAKPPLKTALADTWSPIPDELSYVYKQGFLAWALKHADDARASQEYRIFQDMIRKALRGKDAEQQHEALFPDRPILIG